MLELLQRVHDQESAESAVATILAYDKEVAEMDMRQAYFQSRRKANSEEDNLHGTLLTYERMDCENFKKKMLRCIVNRNLFQYETLERELKPRLQGLWNYFIYMPSFYVSTDRLMAAYKDIHEDPACSAGFRKFVAKCLQLSELLSRVLEALSMIHDEASAIEAGNILKQYDDEIDGLEIRMCYYREVRGKLSKEEEKKLVQLFLRRYDEADAFTIKYLRLWEERGLDQYGDKVDDIRKIVSRIILGVLYTDYLREWYETR